jgi:hypothetical protein
MISFLVALLSCENPTKSHCRVIIIAVSAIEPPSLTCAMTHIKRGQGGFCHFDLLPALTATFAATPVLIPLIADLQIPI